MTAIIETTSIAVQREKDAVGDSPRVTSRLSAGSASDPAEQVAEPAEEDPRHVGADGEERQQLDHRFHGDRRQQASLGLVKSGLRAPNRMPNSAQDDRHQERGVEQVQDRFLRRITLKDWDTAFSWSAMYGISPHHHEAGHQGAQRAPTCRSGSR